MVSTPRRLSTAVCGCVQRQVEVVLATRLPRRGSRIADVEPVGYIFSLW